MEILVALIWVIIGIVYIGRHVVRDYQRQTLWIVGSVLFMAFGIITPQLLDKWLTSIKLYPSDGPLQAIIYLVVTLSPFVPMAWVAHKLYTKGSVFPQPSEEERIKEIQEELKKAYNIDLPERFAKGLLNNPTSPLNNFDKLRVPIEDCFRWVSEERREELAKLSNEELGKLMGLDYEKIPRNSTIPKKYAEDQVRGIALIAILETEGFSAQVLHWGLKPCFDKTNHGYKTVCEIKKQMEKAKEAKSIEGNHDEEV